MSKNLVEKIAFRLYDVTWNIAIPLLRSNQRMADGFDQRILKQKLQSKADLWIQAASVGEAYLAWLIVKNLMPSKPVRIMLTSNTKQGMEILERVIDDVTPNKRGIRTSLTYFPFDRPAIMNKAVRSICPKVMVLLESEIWPGLLDALKKYGSKIIIVNGRLNVKSLKRYLLWPSLWHKLTPDKILAISASDAERFGILFGKDHVDTMPNMKFDRIEDSNFSCSKKNPIERLFRPQTPIIVFGSVRREEEPCIEKIILDIHRREPKTVIALFPRHIGRIKEWKKRLNSLGISWTLRSKTNNKVPCGTIIIWDVFGELTFAYKLSKAAFVGGSLAPLGGQNFLEAALCGTIPVIGPYWDNFTWVGREIITQGLVRQASDWKEVADILLEGMKTPRSRNKMQEVAIQYARDRQGGTAQACNLIEQYLGYP